MKTYGHEQRSRISRIPLLALFYCVLCFLGLEFMLNKLKAECTREVLDGRYIIESFLEAFLKKPFIGVRLNFYKIGHFKYLATSRVAHTHGFGTLLRADPVLTH